MLLEYNRAVTLYLLRCYFTHCLCLTTSVRRRAPFSRKHWAAPLSRTWWVIMVQRSTSLWNTTSSNELWFKYGQVWHSPNCEHDGGTWEQWARRSPEVDLGGVWIEPGRGRGGAPHTSVSSKAAGSSAATCRLQIKHNSQRLTDILAMRSESWRWVENNWMFIFGWTFKMCFLRLLYLYALTAGCWRRWSWRLGV